MSEGLRGIRSFVSLQAGELLQVESTVVVQDQEWTPRTSQPSARRAARERTPDEAGGPCDEGGGALAHDFLDPAWAQSVHL